MSAKTKMLFAMFAFSALAVVGSLLTGEKLSVKDLMGVVPGVVSALGLLGFAGKDQERERATAGSGQAPVTNALPSRLGPSFESGLYGGVLGGALAGVLIGLAYYLQAKSQDPSVRWVLIPEITIYTSVVGLTLGALSQAAMLLFRHAAVAKRYPPAAFNEVSAGLLGGMVAGTVVGVLGGWYFGQRPEPPIAISTLVWGALVGPIPIVLGILLYDYHGRLRGVMRALIISLLVVPFLAMLGILGLQALGIGDVWFYRRGLNTSLALSAGATLGLLVGSLLGLQIGLTLRLYRLWGTMTDPIESSGARLPTP